MGSKKQQTKEVEGAGFKAENVIASGIFPAEVVELTTPIGTKQGGMQIRCKILDGPDKDKIMRRNVLGPVRIGDVLMLRETEIEASPIRGRKG